MNIYNAKNKEKNVEHIQSKIQLNMSVIF